MAADPSRSGATPLPKAAATEPGPPGSDPSSVVLAPRLGVPLGVVVLGLSALALLPLWGGALWLALVVSLFGLFLLLQAVLLRLEFSADALLVWRQQSLLRRFPYEAWLGWRLFWPGLPMLFYFRERQSIHLLPVLFDAATLQAQLEQRLGHLSPTHD